MGQITATRNLVATKVVRLAGQWECFPHYCRFVPKINWNYWTNSRVDGDLRRHDPRFNNIFHILAKLSLQTKWYIFPWNFFCGYNQVITTTIHRNVTSQIIPHIVSGLLCFDYALTDFAHIIQGYSTRTRTISLQWRHNEHNGVSVTRCVDCLLNRWFRRRSKKYQRVTRKMFLFDDVIILMITALQVKHPWSHFNDIV